VFGEFIRDMLMEDLYESALTNNLEALSPMKYLLSCDEIWSRIGDLRKDPTTGQNKLSKDGKVTLRFHSQKPDSVPGMTKEEEIASKVLFQNTWDQVGILRDHWSEISSSPKMYKDACELLHAIHSTQVKASKQVRNLCQARIEKLGLPKGASKNAIALRYSSAERDGTLDKKSVFGIPQLTDIANKSKREIKSLVMGGFLRDSFYSMEDVQEYEAQTSLMTQKSKMKKAEIKEEEHKKRVQILEQQKRNRKSGYPGSVLSPDSEGFRTAAKDGKHRADFARFEADMANDDVEPQVIPDDRANSPSLLEQSVRKRVNTLEKAKDSKDVTSGVGST
jgi:hypothetical protein